MEGVGSIEFKVLDFRVKGKTMLGYLTCRVGAELEKDGKPNLPRIGPTYRMPGVRFESIARKKWQKKIEAIPGRGGWKRVLDQQDLGQKGKCRVQGHAPSTFYPAPRTAPDLLSQTTHDTNIETVHLKATSMHTVLPSAPHPAHHVTRRPPLSRRRRSIRCQGPPYGGALSVAPVPEPGSGRCCIHWSLR